ncbi:MAG: outer membrane protein assembly factor BamB [Betaproteobacteria bacterium]|jgi:outer membrane protein assembly factor BamB|nr:outer membrane protein assembly factor BamB [Betaproteobacteria bacterium]NBT09884.1 outer membrane protein assembly factor BamB [Betaproteobacteria bacterium]NBU50195.1 outer membrane protein assembly factor BamB [Betaproteobacteria bacterium]NBX96671.1 outer membrane protein assembly factor BamB [Betaproteobacteria bacterium]
MIQPFKRFSWPRPALTGLLVGAALSGCSLWSDKPKPAPLESLQPSASVSALWSASDARVDFPMQPGLAANRVATAASDGTVTVRALERAAPLWTAKAGARLSAGVGFDGERAAVVTADNELVVLTKGQVAWRKRLASRVSTAPLVAGERVFVLGLDRAVEAYDALDGRYLWRLQRSSDPLSVNIHGVLMPMGDTLVVGQGARLVGVDPSRGSVRWDLPMATPRGSNEVERLADLVGPALRLDDTVCARAFQLAVACMDVTRGALRWTRNAGGVHAVGGNATAIVGADGSDRMSGWRAESGELLWSHERLLNRQLGGIATWGSWVAVGDAQGQVHVLDPSSGKTLIRLSTDGGVIQAAPRVSGKVMVVVTRKGGVYAWQAP